MKTTDIKTSKQFQSVADDMISEFLAGFTDEKGLVREPTIEDYHDFGHCDIEFMYTQKGMKLFYSYCRKLERLGEKHFPEDNFSIGVSCMNFPG